MGLTTEADFPELTSFGLLFKFAIVTERAAAELAGLAAERDECADRQSELADCAGRHGKRGEQLERIRRERLNEVVLQRIDGMDRAKYVPVLDLPPGGQAMERIIALEESAARFYDDAAAIAANVLAGVEKTLRRLARENRSLAASLRTAK